MKICGYFIDNNNNGNNNNNNTDSNKFTYNKKK